MRDRVEQNRCCEAVLRMIEARLGSVRTCVSHPDREHRTTKEVEICATIGGTRFAIEHTLIEPMEGFVESGHHFGNFINGFDKLVAGRVPTEHAFQLLIPVTALKGIKNKAIPAIRKALADFAIEKMAVLANPLPDNREIPSDIAAAMISALDERDSEAFARAYARWSDLRASRRPPTSVEAKPDGVPFSVMLGIIRVPRPNRLGTLSVVRHIDADIEAKRVQRVARALKEKAEKLKRRKEGGDRTVLVLESNDIALTDDAVFEALSVLRSRVDAAADDIFFADTFTMTYAFWHLVVGGQENNQWHAKFVEFDARDLEPSRT